MMDEDPIQREANQGAWADVDPMFDGHLQKPLSAMTPEERLDWLDEMIRFQHWVRTELKRVPRADDEVSRTGEVGN